MLRKIPSFVFPTWAKFGFVLAAIAAVLFGAYRHGVTTEGARWEARYNKDMASANEALAKAVADARKVEEAAAKNQAAIESEFLKRISDEKKTNDAVIANLRAGNLRLRDEFGKAVCSVAERVPEIAASTGKRDAACYGGFSSDHAEFLILFAGRAQQVAEQLAAAQQVIIQDRLVCGVHD